MNLTYIANIRFPTEKAHGIQIVKTIDALLEIGARVRLVVSRRNVFNKYKVSQTAKDFYDLNNNISVEHLFNIDFLFLTPFFMFFDAFLYFLQLGTYMISVSIYCLKNSKKIYYTRDPLLFCLVIFFNIKFFIELHNFPNTLFGKTILLKILNRSKGVIVTNKNLRTRLINEGLPKKMILVATNGADLKMIKKIKSKLYSRRKLNFSKDKFIALYLGNFYKSKGVYVLINAAKKLADKIQIIIVGGSRIDKNIVKLTNYKKNKKAKNVKILSYVSRKLVPLYLASADVFVLPNIGIDEESKYYTTPLKMFDYMLAKRPIVASNVPALKSFLSSENSIIVKQNNSTSLANGIKKAFNNKELSKKLCKRSFALAKNNSWDNRAKVILKFMNKKIDDE